MIADLLRRSRQAHVQSFVHRGRITKDGAVSTVPNLRQSGGQLQDALSLRLEAAALDPTHEDPAWLEDASANKGISHEALVTFYGRYLSPPLAEVVPDSHGA